MPVRSPLGRAGRSQLARHPAFRAQHALQQGGHMQICIQLPPVKTETGGTVLDLGKVGRCRASQSFRQIGGKSDLNARVQRNDDTRRSPIETRRDGVARLTLRLHASFCAPQFTFGNRHGSIAIGIPPPSSLLSAAKRGRGLMKRCLNGALVIRVGIVRHYPTGWEYRLRRCAYENIRRVPAVACGRRCWPHAAVSSA